MTKNSLENLKVLVSDDLSSVRKILCKLLKVIGIQDITETANGEEAFAQLNQQKFDLVISDWEMPKMNGLELLQKMRENDQSKDIPFIMITANNKSEFVLVAAKAGVSDYISKPFTAEVLRSKIDATLAQSVNQKS